RDEAELDPAAIKIEFHPQAQRATKIGTFETLYPPKPKPTPDFHPWEPFRSRLDFEVAELALEAALNKSQLDRLIKLFHCAMSNVEDNPFTLKNADGVKKMWQSASVLRTQFEAKEYSVLYNKEEYAFTIHMRDPWDWALENIKSATLAQHIEWDAQRHYRWTGTAWERFFTEPWTGDLLWDAQHKLPDNPKAKILPFIIYADKTKLSSFGTAKGYPIVARCALFPHDIRNSDGVGGGRVVGWLPIVHEDTAETGKKNFVNFKNAVWHTGFQKFLAKLAEYSKTGYWVTCGDGEERWLWPLILILSADYEEM
ncbi:hypothetical protein H0H92_011465, partial [Tricholoma furcatifolium]